MELAGAWILAFISVGVAGVLVIWPADSVLERLNEKIEAQIQEKVDDTKEDRPVIEGKYIGRAERLFFTTVVALKLPGFLTAMILWIAAKMAANWGRQGNNREVRARSIAALTLGITSLGMALVVGLAIRLTIIHVLAIVP